MTPPTSPAPPLPAPLLSVLMGAALMSAALSPTAAAQGVAPTSSSATSSAPAPSTAAQAARPCPDWHTLDPASLRAAQVRAERATFTDAAGRSLGRSVNRGERLLQGPSENGRRCSYMISEASVTDRQGYLSNASLQSEATAATLNGLWTNARGDILNVQRRENRLTLRGAALNGDALPDEAGRAWNLADGRCVQRLTPVGAWLIVTAAPDCAAPGELFIRTR